MHTKAPSKPICILRLRPYLDIEIPEMQTWMLVLLCASIVRATNNGFPNALGVTPPRGWRSWNAFQGNISQARISAQFAGATAVRFTIAGVPTSLASLGYSNIGIDDGWDACGQGINGSFHDSNGDPMIDETLFPDMAGMVKSAASENLTMGFSIIPPRGNLLHNMTS
jgi:hypothetical protein